MASNAVVAADQEGLLLSEEESEGLLSEEDNGEEEEATEMPTPKPNRSRLSSFFLGILNSIFPILTTDEGKKKISRKQSLVILLFLYGSHFLSAWGDRMWNFANSLFVALLYPGSLLLPGIFGFIIQLFVVVFGTLVGDWVDTTRRMKVIWVSLLIQNCLVAANAVLLSFMFYYSLTVCDNVVWFGSLMVGVILLGALANLATVANTISVERDWVVVIADNNSSTLAVLNANMRRIDLVCKLIAPIVAGILLTHTDSLIPSLPGELAGGFIATIFIGIWNVVSFFGELSLLYAVYRLFPALKFKKLRGKKADKENENEDNEKCETNEMAADNGNNIMEEESHDEEVLQIRESRTKKPINFLKKFASPYWTLRTGWAIFWKQEVNLVGFAMASLYLTVLGMSGVTTTYFLTQGVPSDFIGIFQGIGGILGILGTLAYPVIQKRVGTTKSGVIANVLQITALSFSVVGVFVPGRPLPDDDNTGYFSVNCTLPSPTPTTAPSPSVLVSPSPTLAPPTSIASIINPSVALVLVGVTGARFGLWMFDLAVSQLVQERVVQEERGVVSGVMQAMNSNMDMLHYIMVIVAPRPQEFPYLTIISFLSVSIGMVFYMFYVRRVYKYSCNVCCPSNQREETNRTSIINTDAADGTEL